MLLRGSRNVGDLIVDIHWPKEDWGLILYKDPYGDVNAYRVLCNSGTIMWFPKEYVEKDCEVIDESWRLGDVPPQPFS